MPIEFIGQMGTYACLILYAWLAVLRWTRVRSVSDVLDWLDL